MIMYYLTIKVSLIIDDVFSPTPYPLPNREERIEKGAAPLTSLLKNVRKFLFIT